MKKLFKTNFAIFKFCLLSFLVFCNFSNVFGQGREGEETVVFEFAKYPKIKHKIIGMIMKDDIPFNDKRTDIGVGEEVLLEIDTKFGNITWVVTPTTAGSIIPKSSTSTVAFHAGLDAATAVIRATPEIPCSTTPFVELTFNIITPILNYPKLCNMHLKDILDAGVYTRVSLLPDNVSFHNISALEKDCFPITTTGLFDRPKFHKLSHNTAPNWVGFHEIPTAVNPNIYTGEGTLMYSEDRAQLIVGNTTTTLPINNNSMLTWNILTDYAKYNDKGNVKTLTPSPIIQQHTIDTYNVPYSKVTKGTNSYQINRNAIDNLCSHCGCSPY